MSVTTQIRATSPGKPALAAAVVAAIALASSGVGASASGQADTAGQPPPEWAENAGFVAERTTTTLPIRAPPPSRRSIRRRSRQLKVKWRFRLRGASAFGIFASTPIVLNGTVYLQDLNSNVYALDRSSGKLVWRHAFNKPSLGPNGVAYGWGRIYGATVTNAFALDARSGRLLWSRKLIRNKNEGIDMAPQLYDDTVLISTVPGAFTNFYRGGSLGSRLGARRHHRQASGGSSTRSRAAPGCGATRASTAAAASGTRPPSTARGASSSRSPTRRRTRGRPSSRTARAGPAPTCTRTRSSSSTARTGRLLWYRQPLPHDIRDYDLEISPILATVDGVETVMVAGKMGKVYAYRSDNGRHLWTRSVGRHQNDVGPLPRRPVQVYPGEFGGVETPMAFAENRLFVPWLDFPSRSSATRTSYGSFAKGRGGLTALAAASGRVLWERKLPQMNFGAATVANDVVFTSTFDGTIYGLDTRVRPDALAGEGPRRRQLVPRDRRRHAPRGRGGGRLLQEAGVRAHRLPVELRSTCDRERNPR